MPGRTTHLAASCTKNFCAIEASPGPIMFASPAAFLAASTACRGPTAAPGCSENPEGRRPPADSKDAGEGGKGKDGDDDDDELSPLAAAPSMPPCRSCWRRRSALRLSWSSWVSSSATSRRLNILDSANDCALVREAGRSGGAVNTNVSFYMPWVLWRWLNTAGCCNCGHDVGELSQGKTETVLVVQIYRFAETPEKPQEGSTPRS